MTKTMKTNNFDEHDCDSDDYETAIWFCNERFGEFFMFAIASISQSAAMVCVRVPLRACVSDFLLRRINSNAGTVVVFMSVNGGACVFRCTRSLTASECVER